MRLGRIQAERTGCPSIDHYSMQATDSWIAKHMDCIAGWMNWPIWDKETINMKAHFSMSLRVHLGFVLTSPQGCRWALETADVTDWAIAGLLLLACCCFLPPNNLLFTFSNMSLRLLALRDLDCGTNLEANEMVGCCWLATSLAWQTERARLKRQARDNTVIVLCDYWFGWFD